MATYFVTVYLVDEFKGSDTSDQFAIPMTRLFRGEVKELDNKSAVAAAWIETVGQYRKTKLESLGASEAILKLEDSKSFVVGKLKPFPVCLNSEETFVFDNGAEVWLVSVDSRDSIFLKE